MKKSIKKSMDWTVIVLLILVVLSGITLTIALPGLKQTADVDAVSSATASSNAYLKAVENALKNGAEAQ